jgi:hypothetical protein
MKLDSIVVNVKHLDMKENYVKQINVFHHAIEVYALKMTQAYIVVIVIKALKANRVVNQKQVSGKKLFKKKKF